MRHTQRNDGTTFPHVHSAPIAPKPTKRISMLLLCISEGNNRASRKVKLVFSDHGSVLYSAAGKDLRAGEWCRQAHRYDQSD